MSPERRRQRRRFGSDRFVIFAIASILSGQVWAGDAAPGTESDGFWGNFMETLNLRTKVGPTPGFVEKTRPDPSTLHFIPTSEPHPKRSVPVQSAIAVEAAKQALDAAREAQLNPPPPAPKPAPLPVKPTTPALHPAKLKRAVDQN